ncbi:glycosyltransferase [Corynebacterium sp. MSK044]|uniref:glycosyltransferase n=1 Tax=Corynebacterium sp. MSK044 TaxID=3050195 RepID=UPI0025500552|nr:glycosyltransferase [Corynebacterium sp. MSK044]MDK8798076.1 glycosyltransferase [Corynebacterium sp. MSK044]
MWIDYAVRQVLHTAGTFARQPGLLLATKAHSLSLPDASTAREGDTVISLTTYGKRLSTAVYAIASLLVGTVRLPVILWLDAEDFNGPWPPRLKRLVQRGLDVRCSDGKYGPHTKYYGTFQEFAGKGVRVITVDDDMMYPRWFVEKLLNAADASPRNVVAYRAHTITMNEAALAPYRLWTATFTTDPSFRHFATGVSGVIYPASMVEFVAARGKEFQGKAPLADDVWLNHCALRSGHRVRQVFPHPREFSIIPMSQRQALVRSNQWGGGNDVQLEATYTDEDIAVLLNEPTDED